MGDNNPNLLEAFRTNVEQRRLEEPKALSSGMKKPVVTKKRKAKNVMIKIYVNGALLLISVALVFVAYRLAVLPEIFPPDVTNKKQNNAPVNISGLDFQGAATFANNFAFNWLSGNREQADNYLAEGLKLPDNVGTLKKQTVNWNIVWQVKPKTNKDITVIVSASVSETGKEKEASKAVYLAIPLAVENGSYGVSGIPTYVPEPPRAKFVSPETTQANVSQADSDNINQSIRLFLTEYFGGSTEKTSVHFTDGQARTVLVNAEFLQIVEMKLVQDKKAGGTEGSTTKVTAEITAEVKIDGTQMLQKFNVNMSKNANKWYIEETDPYIPLFIKTASNEGTQTPSKQP